MKNNKNKKWLDYKLNANKFKNFNNKNNNYILKEINIQLEKLECKLIIMAMLQLNKSQLY